MSVKTASGSERVGVIIAAAGKSTRMGGVDKVFADVLGRPLLAWSVDVFERSSLVDQIVVALDPQHIDQLHAHRLLRDAHGWTKVEACPGGARRQDSVREALQRLTDCEWVLVHDGARPCVSDDLIRRGFEAAAIAGAAIPALPVTDTLKRVGADGIVQATVDREGLWAVQTPQFFRYSILRAAHEQTEDATDDAAMVERTGAAVRIFPGDPENIKVTVQADLDQVAAHLRAKSLSSPKKRLG